ncbi:tetratricopeptide repeat protein [Sediminivirga luteola]|uniref:tetratricopeptide repeat protein n=1 Tax=Sediminivirga luteola TaxID=1774748 RepID=UPI00166C44DF|nr:tetratricopeptide repeat protein [Sediminivirga luteola]MCI2266815.1 tetratricopeptide repeat protein [Sediminivirga luteola]
MRAEAGEPSYAEIARRVASQRHVDRFDVPISRATVYYCFREGRKRFDTDLVVAIVRALTRDEATVKAWGVALASIGRGAAVASVVHVTDALPQNTAPFVGRARELTRLSRHPAAHWIHAMPGAGKTSLALHAAHAAITSGAAAGVILADLRGHSPVGPPAEPQAVVRAVLRLLGEKSKALSAPAATKLMHDKLRANRRILVLDDAASPEQVHGIMPDPSGASVIVTSRVRPTAGRFHAVELPLFAPYESLALLDAVAGRVAIERERASADALLHLTGHQPLAVSLTAARVAARPDWTLAEHLTFARTRRDSLRLDEPVTRSLDLTYQALPQPAQRLLRAIADHPVGLLDRHGIGAIAQDLLPGSAHVDAALAALEQHSLITRRSTGHVEMHELVRVYAADLGLEHDPGSQRHAASERLRCHVINYAWAAHRIRNQARRSIPRAPRTAVDDIALTQDDAEAFFADSAELLLHIALTVNNDVVPEHGPATVNLLAETVGDAFHRAGRTDDAIALHREALRTARARGDSQGELRARVDLGGMLVITGRVTEAETLLSGIDKTSDGWPLEEPLMCNALGPALVAQGRVDQARRVLRKGIAAASDLSDLWREGQLWNSMALLHLRTGNLQQCHEALQRSITLSHRCDDQHGAARGRVNLSKLLHDLGNDADAEAEARQALSEMESLGFAPGIAAAYSNLSAAICALGRFEESAVLAERGLAVAREAANTQAESELLRTLGRSHLGRGHIDDARAVLERSLALAESLGDLSYVAECHEELGNCAHASGDASQAHRLWQQALKGYTTTGSTYAEPVRAKLAL